MRWTLTLPISDRTSPDSTKLGEWLFRRRTLLPLPIAAAILLLPSRRTPQNLLAILGGIAFTGAGEAIRLWGVRHIGVISRTRSDRLGPLVESGPFAIVRNPLYVGNIAVWVGFTLTAGLAWLAPIVFALLALEYHAIVRWEEQLLESRLGDAFRAYALRVPRWIPGSNRRARRDRRNRSAKDLAAISTLSAVAFSWRATMFSERGTLIAIAAGYLLLWIRARF
jgi:protein-S-isoprenylcysteine O-methyltransferase Ste14